VVNALDRGGEVQQTKQRDFPAISSGIKCPTAHAAIPSLWNADAGMPTLASARGQEDKWLIHKYFHVDSPQIYYWRLLNSVCLDIY